MNEILTLGIGLIMLILILLFETFCLSKIFMNIQHKKLLENNLTNLTSEEFKSLNKRISKNLNFKFDGFEIIYAKDDLTIIKIKENYYQYFNDDFSLAFIFSYETLIKSQIED